MRNHLIYRQVLDLRLSSRTEAYELQEQFKTWYYDQFLPVLTALFDTLGSGKTVRIQRLELNLGNLFLQTAPYADPQRLSERIRDQLIEQVPELFQTAGRFDTENLKVAPASQSSLEAFTYFLQHGRLPWYYASDSPQLTDKLLDEVLAKHPASLRKLLKATGGERLIDRLIKQFRVAQWWRIGQRLYPNTSKTIGAVLEDWLTLEQRKDWPFRPADQLFGQAWQQEKSMLWVFGQIKAAKDRPPHQFLAQLLREVAALHKMSYPAALKRLEALVDGRAVRLQALPGTLEKLTALRTSASERTTAHSKDKSQTRKEAQADDTLVPEKETRMTVEQAGLVLLWPYLQSFFERIGLLEHGAFKDEASQERAVLILNYLASGSTDVAEHQAVFSKILAGWPIDKLIKRDFELLHVEEKESQELLRAVIQNWAALRQTSVEGFRSTFLNRKGLLQIEEDRLHLFIERKGVDVLLDRLPWAISSFKLPWQTKPFFVEW